jgi:hypothetical protein
MDNWKQELLKAVLLAGVVAYEWYAMQPYHEPLLAKLWLRIARFCYGIARRFGAYGLAAENEYYLAVGP